MVRQHFFRLEFRHIIDARREIKRLEQEQMDRRRMGSPRAALRRLSQFSFAQKPNMSQEKEAHAKTHASKKRGLLGFFHSYNGSKASSDTSDTSSPEVAAERIATPRKPPKSKKKFTGKLSTDMIKRVEGGGVGLVNPMGWYHNATNPIRRLSADPEIATATMKGGHMVPSTSVRAPIADAQHHTPMNLSGIAPSTSPRSASTDIETEPRNGTEGYRTPERLSLDHVQHGRLVV